MLLKEHRVCKIAVPTEMVVTVDVRAGLVEVIVD